ncbi:MAG: CDC27 family protein, partial [Anaerolineales bacterium]
MVKTSLYRTLRSTLPKSFLSLFLRAVIREPILLRTLENREFLESALTQLGKNPLAWTPTNLALLKIGTQFTPEELRNSPNMPLPVEIRQSAVQIYDTFRHDQDFMLSDLADIGMVALAMRERARILGSWEGLWKELPEKDPDGTRLALVCAYGLIPEPESFVRSLLQESKNLLLCARIIYALPLESEKQARQIARLSLNVRVSDRLSLLRHLEAKSPEDACLLAGELRRSESASSGNELLPESGSTTANIWQLPNSIYTSEIYKNSADSEASFDFYQSLLNQFANLHQELFAEYLIEAVRNHRMDIIDLYQSGAILPVRLKPPALARLSLSLLNAGESSRAVSVLPEKAEHPAILLMQAVIKHQQQNDAQARQLALLAFDNDHFLAEIDFEILKISAQVLLKLEQPYEAAQITRYLVEKLPGDPEILMRMAQAEAIIGSNTEALEYALLAASLAPENHTIQRQLIRCLEMNEDWQQALDEWEALLGWTSLPTSRTSVLEAEPADVRATAFTAARAGIYDSALQLCWQILEKNSDDGLTHLTLGKIYALSGENELALEHTIRANHLVPDKVETWLELAETYRAADQSQQALNTLRTAVQALPEEADLHLAMGELYTLMDQPTQALAACKKAADLAGLVYEPSTPEKPLQENLGKENHYLNPTRGKIAVLLGRLLVDLGHPEQSAAVLRQAYQTREYREFVAYDYARALLGIQNDRQALSALSLAYQHNPENGTLALEYAHLLMKLGEQPDVAVDVLQKILADGSYAPEVLGLLAEALAASLKFQAALVYYQKAMETNIMADPGWGPRLSIGLSHVAIKTGSPNLAIAALQEAIHKAPQHLVLRQKLSEACAAAMLEEDAILAAQNALEIAPADVENLLWFARQMLNLHSPALAQSALEDAAELSPNNPGLLIQLAQTQHQLGKTQQARENYQKAAELPEITLEQLYLSARGLLDLKDPEGAINCLEKVQLIASTSLSEVNLSIILLLAQAYEEVGQYHTALEMLEHALLLDKESVALLKQKARIHRQLDQHNAACACLAQVLILTPADAQAYHMLADIYETRGELHLALENAQLYFDLANEEEKAEAANLAAQLSWKLFRDNEAEQFLNSIDLPFSAEINEGLFLKLASLRGLFLITRHKRDELEDLLNLLANKGVDSTAVQVMQ